MFIHASHGQAFGNHSLKAPSSWWRDHKIVTDWARRKLFNEYEDTRNVLKGYLKVRLQTLNIL
jgi:predicted alpha/beta superfamily hydrolase